MAYLGNNLQAAYSSYLLIDSLSASFNGTTTSFALKVNGVAPVPFPLNEQNVLISVGGVPQKPDPTGAEGFKFSGTNIVFSSAPKTGEAFWGVVLAGADYVNVGVTYPDGTAATPSITFNSTKTTGLYLAGSSTLGFTTAGVLRSTIDSNGNFSVLSAGSATAPSVAVGTGTTYIPGIYSPGADQLAISTGGTGRLFVDANGFASHTGAIGRGAPVTKTGAFTVGIAENWLICNGTASITVTLPTASAWTGREIMLKTIAAFTVISASSNVVPLAGSAAGTAILAATAGKFATLVSDGTNWIIMQAN